MNDIDKKSGIENKMMRRTNLLKQSKTGLFLFLLLITACNMGTKRQTLQPKLYAEVPDLNYYYFRPVLIGEKYFDYRTYDYKGGFYICAQIAIADKKEHEKQVRFDRIKRQSVFLMRYSPKPGNNYSTYGIQDYTIHYLKLPSLNSLDTINFETVASNPEWRTLHDLAVEDSTMPDYMLLLNYHREQVKELEQTKITEPIFGREKRFQSEWVQKFFATIEKESPLDIRLVEELKAQCKYDTILKTGHSTMYIDTDYTCYEILNDPEVFYVSERKYYPNHNCPIF